MQPPRYAPNRSFPPYAFLPGRDPHPTRDPAGHSYAAAETPARYHTSATWRTNEDYLFGVDLYNHGYLWEAHEVWEGLWHAAKHDPPQADFLQGLIQCTAAALKVLMNQPRGLSRLADLGTERIERVARSASARYMGLDLLAFTSAWRRFAATDPTDADDRPLLELATP